MTDGHTTDGHTTDEQLSSYLDGEEGSDAAEISASAKDGRSEVGGHLTRCASCRARLAALESVRDLVRTPVPAPDPEARAASIAAVLRESRSAPAGTDAGGADVPTPIHARRRPQVLVGSAAAVLILAAAIAVPVALSGRHTSGTSAQSSAARASRGAASSGAASSASPNGQPVTETEGLSKFAASPIADLGPLDSVRALGARAAGVPPLTSVATPNAAVAPGAGAGAAAAAPTEPRSSPGGTISPATTSAAASAAGSAAGSATISMFERCLASAASAARPGTSVQALATGDFEGTPALIYVFASSSARSATASSAQPVAVATARTGCRVLGTSSF